MFIKNIVLITSFNNQIFNNCLFPKFDNNKNLEKKKKILYSKQKNFLFEGTQNWTDGNAYIQLGSILLQKKRKF